MIIYFLEIIFVIFLFRMGRKNKCYYVLCGLQALSFILAPLVDNHTHFETATTILNAIYCFTILSFIILPWRDANFNQIYVRNRSFYHFYKKCLYFVLKFTILNNLIVFAIVVLFIPDIATFKASQGFHELYDRIPYFGLSFRYTSVSRYIGFMAMPIWIYYLSIGNMKEARRALIMSSATLIAAIAFYSRAQILIYTLMIVCMFMLTRSSMTERVSFRIEKILKLVFFTIVGIFAVITVLRFSGMDYYGERIPKSSIIQNPILYSIVDYTSKGDQLELHESNDLLYGESCVQSLATVLSYFHLIDWSAEEYSERAHKVFSKSGLGEQNDEGSFHGYTCRVVKNFGYILSFILNMIYFLYVRARTKGRKAISLGMLTVLTFLLVEPINAIFYMDYDMMSFPILFYLFIRILNSFRMPFATRSQHTVIIS